MKTHLYPVLALAVITLSACGGGSGSSSTAASNLPETSTPADSPASQTSRPVSNSSDTNLVDSNLSESGNAIGQAGTSKPIFGSITQSSNVDSTGETTDTASGSFDGSVARITVTQTDGSFTFANDAPAYYERDYPQSEFQVWAPLPYDSGNISYHARIDDEDDSFHADYIGVIWNSDDVAEHSVWGYWLRSDGNPYEPGVEFEAGAFVDGPEIDPANPPTLPSSGTASYSGEAQGVYHYQYGPENGELANAVEIGQYVQPFSMTVNFADASISVCGACTGSNRIWGTAVSPDGTVVRTWSGLETAYRYEGTATLNSDGTFRTQQVTLTNSVNPVTDFSGSMGGIFSNVPDSNGNPRMVSGTSGGEYTQEDGSSGSYVGTFGARTSP